MLKVPQLDDLSYDRLFERARSRIPTLTEEWTDFNASDPGITTLQVFSWLIDTLHYYMDATGEVHRLKYLKLLGIEPKEDVARCIIAVNSSQEDIIVPRGARMLAGGTVFELEKSYNQRRNRLVAVYNSLGNKTRDITALAGVDGTFVEIFSHKKESKNILYIGFESMIGGEFRFFVDIEENKLRNPFTLGFSLSDFDWEYYNGSKWESADLVSDATGGFLRSGFITLQVGENASMLTGKKMKNAYYVRAVLKQNEFDVLPKLGKITANCAEAVQTDTVAQALEYTYTEGENLVIDYAVEREHLITVAVQTDEGYMTWYEHSQDDGSMCNVIDGEHSWQKIIEFDKDKYKTTPKNGDKVLVLLTPYEAYEQMIIGATKGVAEERIDFDIDGIREIKLALVHAVDGRSCYDIWEQCENLNDASYEDKVFYYDKDNGQIVFGDGIKGLQPDAGKVVVVVTLKKSDFERGNVVKGAINTIITEDMAEIAIESIESAKGGKRKENSVELETQLESKMRKINRAVTTEDYTHIVKTTPGLMIDHVNVITMAELCKYYDITYKPNTVHLAVKPHSDMQKPDLSNRQRQFIVDNIDQYRLLTTNIQVISPKYVTVNVFGRIAVRENTPNIRAVVEEKLNELITFSSTGGFGKSVVYGKVFSSLEMIDGVTGVAQLSFEAMGKGASKNERGDVVIYPDAMACLGKISIEYV